NINQGETAAFSGAAHIENVISRVTGGSPSNINGMIRNSIPGADTYLMNPAGIMFGEHAQLDVQGGFHTTTADYLKFEDGGKFHADTTQPSNFSVSSLQSFGFLDKTHGAIEVNRRGYIPTQAHGNEEAEPHHALLQVPENQSLSLIGGDIHLSQGIEDLPTDSDESLLNNLWAPGGRLNLAAVRSVGEVTLSADGIASTAEQGASVSMEQGANLNVSGDSSNVFIHAGEFLMDNALIFAIAMGEQAGGVVDIQATNITLDNASLISGGTAHIGDGTDIYLNADNAIHLLNGSAMNTDSLKISEHNQITGNAGHIHLQAKDIEIKNNYGPSRLFSTDSYGTGRGGDITMVAENRLDIINSYIQSATWNDKVQAGDGGDVYLQAEYLNFQQGSTLIMSSEGRGNVGRLTLKGGQIHAGGINDYGDSSLLGTYSSAQSDSGDILIQADELLLEDGMYLVSANVGKGNGGDISIQLSGTFTARGASAATGLATAVFSGTAPLPNQQAGQAGDIHIQAASIQLEDGALIYADSQATNPGTSSQDAGNIHLDASNIRLSGVNLYGEALYGFGSTISASSLGEYAGQAGDIQIQADSVEILDGASIESGSDNPSDGGNIQIQATEQIRIHGDASDITLLEPLEEQALYLANYNPETYNQSISGVYAHVTSQAANSGDSGHIKLNAPLVQINKGGQISTANRGGGKAGHISLNVETLELDNHTLIRSNSELANQFSFEDAQARDSQLLEQGTVVKTIDDGEGRTLYQINFGDRLFNLMPITQVEDMAALEALPTRVNMLATAFAADDIVTVKDDGSGQVARFAYTNYEFAAKNWTRVNENNRVVLPHSDISFTSSYHMYTSIMPYANGSLIHVEDIGNGKAADYVYIITTFTDGPNHGTFLGEPIRIKYYQLTDLDELQTFTDNIDVFTGIQVDIAAAQDGQPARFVYDGVDWVHYGKVLEVPDIEAQQNLVLAKPGYITHLPEGDSIFTGKAWIDLGNTYRVANLSQRNALNVQQGDLVKVADTGNGRHDAFLYANSEWIPQIRGGNAGEIELNVGKMHLSQDSEISTSSVSGGGGEIDINANGLVQLKNSQITTSVQEDAGNGGNLNIDAAFLVQDQAPIIARAVEGSGGNIAIETKGVFKF
ncbi:filamentous hemagglutinin N-terminal domain-containing protein, partial [Candidatus Venteria ishoeyi]|uniref:two-partner secretion domain-containing protein n=1 Tax=Candidatus Venteria ishoeyi TaxID=1899563 RepID=UPI0025A4EB1D